MDNKYYTPSINEFIQIDFKFEYLSGENWNSFKVTEEWFFEKYNGFDNEPKICSFIRCLKNKPKLIRCEYLDREDIASLGFELTQYLATDHDFEWHIKDKDGSRIGMFIEDSENPEIILYDVSFKIKNKNELEKLMKQLGINLAEE